MFVCVYSVFVLSSVGSGLATGGSLVQGVLPTVYKCKITEPHKEEAKARNGPERHIRRICFFLWSIVSFAFVVHWSLSYKVPWKLGYCSILESLVGS
jgi:hypothetical protein